jgi:hypothetical protein
MFFVPYKKYLRCRTTSNDVEWRRTISSDNERCQTMSCDVAQCRVTSNDVEWRWTMSSDVKRCRMTSHNVEWRRTTSSNVRRYRWKLLEQLNMSGGFLPKSLDNNLATRRHSTSLKPAFSDTYRGIFKRGIIKTEICSSHFTINSIRIRANVLYFLLQ